MMGDKTKMKAMIADATGAGDEEVSMFAGPDPILALVKLKRL